MREDQENPRIHPNIARALSLQDRVTRLAEETKSPKWADRAEDLVDIVSTPTMADAEKVLSEIESAVKISEEDNEE